MAKKNKSIQESQWIFRPRSLNNTSSSKQHKQSVEDAIATNFFHAHRPKEEKSSYNIHYQRKTDRELSQTLEDKQSLDKEDTAKLNITMTVRNDTPLLNVLEQEENINIRHNPIATVEKAVIWLNPLEVLDQNKREEIIDQYIELFILEKDDKTMKENSNRYRPHLKEHWAKDEFEFKEKYINPIVRLMPPEVKWAAELETKLIQKLINDPLGNSLNNDE